MYKDLKGVSDDFNNDHNPRQTGDKMTNHKPFSRVKNALYGYKVIQSKIRIKEIELERVKSEYFGIRANGDSLPSGSISKTVENEVIQKSIREQEIENEIAELQTEIEKIETVLNVLNESERTVIEECYFNERDYYEIAEIIGYSYMTVFNYHKNAMIKLSQVY